MESRKNDIQDNKLRWELLPLSLIKRIVEVYHFGAGKYSPNSWQRLDNGYERYKAALLRHICAHEEGEFTDSESGLPHLAHAAWNAIAMLHFGLQAQQEKVRAIQPKSKYQRRPREESARLKQIIIERIGEGKTYGDIAKEIGVYTSYVSTVARNNGIRAQRGHHAWTGKEEQLLWKLHKHGDRNIGQIRKEHFPDVTYPAIRMKFVELERRYAQQQAG